MKDCFADPVAFNDLLQVNGAATIIIAKELDPIGQFLHELANIAHEAEGITRCQTGRTMLLADADVIHDAAELLTKASERLKTCGMPF